MRLDPLILRRFEELEKKAEAVLKSRALVPDLSSYKVSSALFHEWATSALSLLDRTFGVQSVHFKTFSDHHQHFAGWEDVFINCHSIFKAARDDYAGGYLFSVRALAKAEVLADAFSQSRELLAAGLKDAACILGRVALETVLKELSDRHNIPHSKLDRMNGELCKVGACNIAKQKQITAWAEIGNKSAHGAWDQYTDNDAKAMLDGVEALVADVL